MDRSALDASPVATIVLRDGRMAYLNPAAVQLFGRPASEAQDEPYQRFLAPEEVRWIAERMGRRLRGEEVPDDYQTTLVVGGERRRVQLHVALAAGEVVVQIVDLADRRVHRERLMKLEQLGARVQREQSSAAIFSAMRSGLEGLDLGLALLHPDGEELRVGLVGLPPRTARRLETALGQPLAGFSGTWAAGTSRAWHEGVAWAEHLPDLMGGLPGEAVPSVEAELTTAGLLPAVAVRVDTGDAPHALLVIMGGWLGPQDLPAFRLFGVQVSAALDGARAILDLSRRNEELAALNRLAETAATAPDLPSFFARGAEELKRSLECDGVAIWLLDEARQEMELAFEVGATPEARSGFRRVPVAGSGVGQVLREGVPRLIQQSEYPPQVRAVTDSLGFRSHGSVPLRIRAKVVGVMNVAWREPRDASTARLDLLQAMGGPFASAVEAQRLLADLRGRVSELTLLNDVALAAANLNPAFLLETFLRRVVAALSSDAGTAYLTDAGGLMQVASVGIAEEALRRLGRYPVSREAGEIGEAVRSLAPVLVTRMAEGSPRARLLQAEGLETGLAVPIAVKGQALGAFLVARRRPEPYRRDEVQLLSAVAAQLGVAVDNARLFADTRRRVSDLEVVNQLSLSVFGSGPGDAAALLQMAAGEIGRALGAFSVAVMLLDRAEQVLRPVANWGTALPDGSTTIPLRAAVLATEVLEAQAPVQCADTSTDPRSGMRGVAAAPPMSMLIVPLTSRRAPRGVVAIAGEPGRRFGEAEVALAFALTSTAATGLENAELHAETRRRAEELGWLLEVGRSLVATLELKQVLDAGVANLARMVGAPDAYLFLADPAGRELEIRAAAGSFPELVGSRVPVDPPDDSLGAMTFHRREPLGLEDGGAGRLPPGRPGARSLGLGSGCLGLPLVVRDHTIGAALIVDPRGPRRFTAAEVERASAIANQLAVAVENARLYDDLRRSYAELARAQAQLVQRERLAALGELSAVVAHEVRNPLGVIFNSLGSLRRVLKPEGDARMLLEIIGEEADRLNRIVGDLLDFARPSPPALRPEALDRLVEEAVGAALAENRDIAVERDIGPDLSPVSMDARLMRQAVLNVAVNAVQAMPRGGTLTVRARRDGPWARVEIRDSGPGIPDEIRQRIFEPFFTTKASGTGLGLAVVKRIVEGHGGDVAVANDPGSGAAFTIRIPVAHPAPPGEEQS